MTTPSGLHVTLRTVGTVQVGRIVRLRVTLNRAVRLRATLQVLRNHRYRRLMSTVVSRAHPVVAFRPRARGQYVLRLRYTYRGKVHYSPTLTLTLRG